MTKLSIITINYHTEALLHDCLTSLYKNNSDVDFELLIVDNGSTKDALAPLKKNFPKAKIITPEKNLGFGKANNLGAKHAKGEYLLFLNPDTIIPSSTLSSVLKQLENLSNLGAYTCQLRFSDGTIQPSGGYFPTLTRIISWQIFSDIFPLPLFVKPIHPSPTLFKNSFSPDWIQGAFFLVPSQVFKKISGFDENIFMYAEDIDICYRLKQLGLNIYYSNSPSITHLQSKSSTTDFVILSEITGIKYLAKKLLPAWQLPIINFAIKLGSLLRLLIFGIILGNDQKRHAFLEAFLHY